MLNQVNIRNVFLSVYINIFKDFGIAIWLKNGAPAHKLVLGIPLFARSFLLARSDQNQLHSPTIGNGTEGPFTRSAGFLSYFEVKNKNIIF
jgi:chitinase